MILNMIFKKVTVCTCQSQTPNLSLLILIYLRWITDLVEVMEFQLIYFQILKDDAVKALHSICQQIWKSQQ